MGPSYAWQELLTQSSNKLLALNVKPHLWPPNASQSRWLGAAGATEEQIRRVETTLQTRLPPSYRSFLTTTNGWTVFTPFVWRIFRVEEIGWYGPRHPKNLAILRGDLDTNPIGVLARLFGWTSAPFTSEKPGLAVEHLQSALEIAGGSYTDAVEYVLNPHIQNADGEWEAWIIRWWKPLEMERFASFWDLLQAEYRDLH